MAEDLGFTAEDLREWLACSDAARERVWMQSGFFAERVEEVSRWADSRARKYFRRGSALASFMPREDVLSLATDAVLDALRTAKPHDPLHAEKPVYHAFADPDQLLRYVRRSAAHRCKDFLRQAANEPTVAFEELLPAGEEGDPEDRFLWDDPWKPASPTPEEAAERGDVRRAAGRVGRGFEAFLAASSRAVGLRDHLALLTEAVEGDDLQLLAYLHARADHGDIHAWFARRPGFNQNTYNSQERRLRLKFAEYIEEEGSRDFEEFRECLEGFLP